MPKGASSMQFIEEYSLPLCSYANAGFILSYKSKLNWDKMQT